MSTNVSARPGTARSASGRIGRAAAVGALMATFAISVAACDMFSGDGSTPSASPPATATQAPTATSTPTPTPSPSPQLLHSVTLVIVGQIEQTSPTGLAWAGVQDAAATLGVTPNLVQAASAADLDASIAAASSDDGAVVVTVGAAATDAVATAAAAHPATVYLELGVAAAENAPSNVHGVVFDQAQTGYLAGFVAASFSTSGTVAFVGDVETDPGTNNYVAGFQAGAREAAAQGAAVPAAPTESATPLAPVLVSYVGSATAPEKGRAASAAAVKAGADVLTAQPSLSGLGAMRDACGRKVLVVGIGAYAWQTLPDVEPCLIASVGERLDVVVRDSVLFVAHGGTLPSLVVGSVANGGIVVSDLQVEAPAGFSDKLGGVLAAMAGGS
jgi:basic membrane protein A